MNTMAEKKVALAKVIEELAARHWDLTAVMKAGSPDVIDAEHWTITKAVEEVSAMPIAVLRFHKDDLKAGMIWQWDLDPDEMASGSPDHGFIEDLTAAQIAAGMIEE